MAEWYNPEDFDHRPRAFTKKQKEIILERQDYICDGRWGYSTCPDEAEISIHTAEFHHLWAYGDSGPTETWNGVALCKECHKDITRHQNTRYFKI